MRDALQENVGRIMHYVGWLAFLATCVLLYKAFTAPIMYQMAIYLDRAGDAAMICSIAWLVSWLFTNRRPWNFRWPI
jgi:hypothetical protein